jgi:predicted acylesterase/phospholipase RssA
MENVPAAPPASRVLPLLAALPVGTESWLAERAVESCIHVRRSREADIARLGRILTGRAIAVVLSGGGAKGFAHLGVLRALGERGIPVDMIGGTSMGSVIAAGYAMSIQPRELTALSKRLFATHKPFREYTLPLVSLFRGRRLDRMLREQTGETRIEDLWIGYFCVSTDLTAAEPHIHTSGCLFTAVRSSIAIPGILPPVVEGDRLLVDGGVVNNLPADAMRQLCRGKLIAVDVAPKRDVELGPGFSEYPSPWQVLWNRLWPFGGRRRIQAIPQIMARTTMLSSIHRVNAVKTGADYYLRPPVEQFGMLEFDAIDRIVESGYRYALESTEGWGSLGTGPTPPPA